MSVDSEQRDWGVVIFLRFGSLEQTSILFINIQNNKNNIYMYIYRISIISKGIKFNMQSDKT